LKSVFLACVSN